MPTGSSASAGGSGRYDAAWRFGKKRRTFEVQGDGPLAANELALLVAAARDGAGLIQAPLPHVAPELAAGQLVTVLADRARRPVDGFFLYYPSNRQIRPPLKALVDHLRDAYRRPRGGTRVASR